MAEDDNSGSDTCAPIFRGVRPLLYQFFGSDPEFVKMGAQVSDPLLPRAVKHSGGLLKRRAVDDEIIEFICNENQQFRKLIKID